MARGQRVRRFLVGLLPTILAVSCGERPDSVSWPPYAELPESLQYAFVQLERGAFVTEDGRRAFLIGVYSQDDPRFDLYGQRALDRLPPDYGLYDPDRHGWIYERPLDADSFRRIGFNLYSITLTPKPFYERIGYEARVPQDPDYVEKLARDIHAPFYVDYVAWPWTLGAPGTADADVLPPDAINPGRNHWVPYRTIGKGREVWLELWRLYAERLRDANVPVMMYELFNEPIYIALTHDHRWEFITWLQERYGTLKKVNETWGSVYGSWREIQDHPSPMSDGALWLDYDEYLADTFAELFKAGQHSVREVDPDAVCVIQPTKRAIYEPPGGVHLSKVSDLEEVIVGPTDGGLWTPGDVPDRPADNLLDCPLAPAPISSDLMFALAGERMLFENELYLTGQTRRSTRNDFWAHVLLGYDGATLFSWSKRGWAWWDGKRRVEEEAEKHPYCALLPPARRTKALRGVLDFALEIEEVRDLVLPKPWEPKPRVAFLWSWGNARRRAYDGEFAEKTMEYYAALRYTHWPMTILPSDAATPRALSEFDVVIAAGMDYLERSVVEPLANYVLRGGLLILGETLPVRTPYGPRNGLDRYFDLRFGEIDKAANSLFLSDEICGPGLPREINLAHGVRAMDSSPGTDVILRDGEGRPVVVEQTLGSGAVWYQAAEIHGYSLATLLSWLLERAGVNKPVSVYARDGEYATNILLSSRYYENHIALLFLNKNRFPARLRISAAASLSSWSVSDPLDTGEILSPSGDPLWSHTELLKPGIPLDLDSEDFRLIIVKRKDS